MDKYIAAANHLKRHDPILASVIERWGGCTIKPHNDYFIALASSIVGQQLSVKVANTIRARLAALGGDHFPSPQQLVDLPDQALRDIGLSGAKVAYIKNLSQHVIDGRVELGQLPELTNEETIVTLTDVKGVGEWTAHMFLIFCVGRLDVLPIGDLGVRKGAQALYGLTELPTPVELMALAQRNGWQGYESVAAWYIWRSLENEPA